MSRQSCGDARADHRCCLSPPSGPIAVIPIAGVPPGSVARAGIVGVAIVPVTVVPPMAVARSTFVIRIDARTRRTDIEFDTGSAPTAVSAAVAVVHVDRLR